MPQSPYAKEKVVAEIVRQLGNWNIETHQNGGVTSSQGGFNFDVDGVRTIRAPDISFTPSNVASHLNYLQKWTFQGRPFTPLFVVEVANVSSDSVLDKFDNRFKTEFITQESSVELGFLIHINPDADRGRNKERGKIYSWRWYPGSIVRRYEHEWRDMNTRIGNHEVLPGFILQIELIEDVLMDALQDSGSSSEDEVNVSCPECTVTFTNRHFFSKHYQIVHARKQRGT